MAIEVKVPIPDQTTEEVRIVVWKKNVGDAVAHGEVILARFRAIMPLGDIDWTPFIASNRSRRI